MSAPPTIVRISAPQITVPSWDPVTPPHAAGRSNSAYYIGSGNDHDGSVLAAQGDVVVVTVNYRLGVFGFLDLSKYDDDLAGSASNGLRDQILALTWVRDNIGDYGGR